MSEQHLIPGLALMKLNVGSAKRPRMEFYFLIKLDDITRAVVQGRPSLGPSDTSGTQDFWSDWEIAQLILNLGPGARAKLSEDDKARLARNALDILGSSDPEHKALNQQAWKYSRSADPSGWNSYGFNPEGAQEMGPTVLYVPAGHVRTRKLAKRYRTLVSFRKHKVFHEDIHYTSRLGNFYTEKLKPLKDRQAELDRSLSVVRHVTARVSNAHRGVVAMFDCAASSSARRELWNAEEPLEKDELFRGPLVPRRPSGTERENAKSVRDSYLPKLFKELSEVTAWMSSGTPDKNGKVFVDAKLRNSHAQELLDALRANEDILDILENHTSVDRMLWKQVETILLESFHYLLLAPNTRDALLLGELSQLAVHVSRPVPPLDVLSEKTKRARDVKAAMERFVLDVELDREETRLGQAFLSLKSHADPVLDHRSTVTKLWSLATPSLMDHIERVAKKAGDPDPSAVAASWGFRSAFGVVELDEDTQKAVWEKAVEFTDRPSKANAKKIFAVEGLQVENRFWNSAAAWSAYETAVAVISANEAMHAHQKAPTVDTAIEAWTAALEAVKSVPDLAAALKETHAFIRILKTGRAASLIDALANLGDSMPMKFLDGVVTLLKLEATARATQAVMKSKTASEGDKDIAKEKETLAEPSSRPSLRMCRIFEAQVHGLEVSFGVDSRLLLGAGVRSRDREDADQEV